jgi:SDR family mycofactocin-dependent oxidoreductase
VGELDGKVALVTGGARGQGRVHAVTLATRGCDVAVCDIAAPVATVPYDLASPGDLAETARLVEGEGRRCLSVVADVRDSAGVRSAVDATVTAFGRLDILVANAGICSFAPVAELSDEAWEEMVATNLTGVFKTVRAVIPHMVRAGSGRIVATSSMGGRMGMPNLAHYVAAKWGVIGLIKSVALEVAPHGVTANVVCPATVDTPMAHNPAMYGLFCPDLVDPGRDDVRAAYERMNPMRVPWLDPHDVAAAVAFLVSDSARHISGATIEVSAGGSALMH